MIENISSLFSSPKKVFKSKKKIDVIDSRSHSVEEAKAKVDAILQANSKKNEQIQNGRV